MFSRVEGRLVPTSDGYNLYHRLEQVFRSLEIVDSQNWKSESDNSIRISTTPTFANTFLARVISDFLKLNDGVEISVGIAGDFQVQNSVAGHHTDLGLRIADSGTKPGLTNRPFAISRSVCLLPPGHPMESADVLTPQMLSGSPLIVPSTRFSSRAFIEQTFLDANATLNVAAECGDSKLVADCVRRHMGIGIINPFPAVQDNEGDFSLRPFDPSYDWTAVFTHREADSLPKAAREFVNLARRMVLQTAFVETVNDAPSPVNNNSVT